jgi:hypothetical protein
MIVQAVTIVFKDHLTKETSTYTVQISGTAGERRHLSPHQQSLLLLRA